MDAPVRIRIARIYPNDSGRSVNRDKVNAIAESIEEIGLRIPITVRPTTKVADGREIDAFEIVAGQHRYEAACQLGWEEIDAVVSEDDDLHAELWEIDENLMRAELTATEEAEHLARRKELWKAREVSEKAVPKPQGGRPEGFASNTSKATGKTKQAINRATKRAHEVTSEARDLIRNTALDTGTYLDKLMKVPEGEQVERVQRDLASLADKERRGRLKREKVERDREAKEAREAARIEVCDMLLDRLSLKDWDRLIALIEAAGGSLKADDLRKWQSPANEAA